MDPYYWNGPPKEPEYSDDFFLRVEPKPYVSPWAVFAVVNLCMAVVLSMLSLLLKVCS